jgi:deazaflavin-dependent oxidoreductase (nitroreductase family)
VFASKAGAPTNPDWYHNLRAHPDVSIEVGAETIEVTATEAAGEERERLFSAQAAAVPVFAGYQEQTERAIPVVVLSRR